MCLPYFHMASPLLLVDHGAAATAVQKKACRAAAAYAAFAANTAAAAASAAASAAVLLLCCYCCHIRVPLLRVPKRNMLCLAMPTDDSFFRCEICIFCDLMDFQRFAHRKHSQSDARMNLAFFKFQGVIG